MKILVIGASGLIGSHYVKATKFGCLTPDEKELDITNIKSVNKFITKNKPDTVVNFAAYTDTKNAETERNNKKGKVWKINTEGPRNLAKICSKINIHLIHISTDLIFAGKDTGLKSYTETSRYDTKLKNISWYGITKMEGEKSVRKNGGKWAIVRIAYPFAGPARPKTDLLHNILSLYDSKNLYPMFDDNTITPTYINDLIKALEIIIKNKKRGIFHVVSSGAVSHYEFAKYALEKSGRKTGVLKKAKLEEFAKTSNIPRPLHIRLDNKKTIRSLNISLGTWKQNINKALKELSF